MKNKIIYHGSIRKIVNPLYNFDGASKVTDYGRAFYCAEDIESGKEWACKSTENGVLNVYSINERKLKIIDLTNKEKYSVLNWIAILMKNRDLTRTFCETYEDELNFLKQFEVDFKDADVIIGFRADDAYFKFPKLFISGNISFEKLEEIYQMGNLGKQYVVYSEKAFRQLTFLEAIDIGKEYFYKYQNRVELADEAIDSIEQNEKHLHGTTIRELMSREMKK